MRLSFCSALIFICMANVTARAQHQQMSLWFPFNGKARFLLGANLPWYNGYRGLDLAPYRGSKTIASVAYVIPKKQPWLTGRFGVGTDVQRPSVSIQPGSTGFNAEGIEAQFRDMQAIGIHVLRWFIGDDGRAFLLFDQNENCTGIDPVGLENLDRVMALAEANQVYLVPVLLNFRFISGDRLLRFEDGSAGPDHADVIRDSEKRRKLIENFIQPLVKRYSKSNSVLYWEIMNEAGNVVEGVDTATGFRMGRQKKVAVPETFGSGRVSITEMRRFLNETYDAIKSVDQEHMIMPSGLARPWELPLVVGQVKADLFGAHYKDDGSDYDRIEPVAAIQSQLKQTYGLVLDKPLVMTEGPSQLSRHLQDYLNGAYSGGWAGYFPWSYYGLIGVNDMKRYPHVNVSRSGDPNVEFYKAFNQLHADAVSLGK